MSRTRSITFFLLLIVSVALGFMGFNGSHALFTKNEPYSKLWKRVDSCENKGLTESALKIVEEIYTRSKTENNAPQLVKSVIYRMKFAQYKEEFSLEKNINQLQAETNSASFPARSVLESLLAESYWQYYQNNRWKFYNRTQTVAFDKGDVATYDLKSLVEEVISHYRASLKDTALLKATKVEVFEEVITPGSKPARLWRPTLYDFLAHRALDFFKNSEAGVTKAANQFALNDEAYLKPYADFLKFNPIKPQDSLDLKYYAVTLFQDLLRFQLQSSNEDGLADLEMERLAFTFETSHHQAKDSLYLASLSFLEKRFEKNQRVAEIKRLQALWWLSKAPEYNALDGENLKWNRKKALEICNGIVRNHPSTRGAQLAKNTVSEILAPALSVTLEETNDVAAPNRVLVKYTNVTKVYFRLVKTGYFDFLKLQNKYYDKEAITKLPNLPTVQQFEQVLPEDKDYNPHTAEVKVPAMEAGQYVLLASTSPQFLAKESSLCYQLYVASNMAYLSKRKAGGCYDFYVLDRQNGKPLNAVNAQLWYSVYNYKSGSYEFQKGKSYTSNEQGAFSVESAVNSNNFMVEFSNGTDQLFSKQEFYNYKEYDNHIPETRSFIFTDRAIYRPGQTVYFKAILLKGFKNKHELRTGQAVTITFYDVNNQKIASQDLVSNDYGTVAGSFMIPQGVLTGQMRITDNYGTAYISVEEYKRPKFEVTFDTLRGSYRLNDEVSLKGLAKGYAGNVVDGAAVNYRVLRRVNYPYWWYWYRPYYRQGSEVEITNGTAVTNEKGEFEIKFKALPDLTVSKEESPTYSYEISADITDLNGETHSAQTDFRVGYKALELSFSCPDVINVQELPKVTISAVNLNGIEVAATGQLTVYELKQPEKVFRRRLWAQPDKHIYTKQDYYKLFPNDLYEDETNQYKWEKLRKAFTRNFNTQADKGIVISEFKELVPGMYLVEGTCKDKFGEEVKSLNYITVFDPAAKELPVKAAQWSNDLKTTAEPGEKAGFILASSYSDVNYLYDLEGEARRETAFRQPSLKPLEIIVSETDRGGLSVSTHFIKYGRVYASSHYITVPFSHKDLLIDYASFRNKLLPGQKEEWKLTVKNRKGEKAAAEMVAAMYDASLDAFRSNSWNFNIYNSFYPRYQWTHSLERELQPYQYNDYTSHYTNVDAIYYDQLNYFGLSYYGSRYYGNSGPRKKFKTVNAHSEEGEEERSDDPKAGMAAPMAEAVAYDKNEAPREQGAKDGETISREGKKGGVSRQPADKEVHVAARKNFNETAFFFPQLQTNENGEVLITFTIPESLTKWKFMALAHSKDLSYGQTQNEVVTQKELMVVPNAPRFFRENDKMTFVSKVSNLSDKELSGTVELRFYDAFTEQDITGRLLDNKDGIKNISVKKGQSSPAEWNIHIPENFQAIKYKVVARAGNFSDGEEMAVPVLTNRMLVTESLPLPVRGNQTKEFVFSKFLSQNNGSATLRNHAYTLEFTANPAWYAIQSLPYLMEYPYECAEQTFARYYSNALASHVVSSKPKIKQVFEAWKSSSPESFLSNLEKNQELKALVLEETQWVLQSKNESEDKKRVALLFDLNKMSNELNAAITRLAKMQTSNGAWPWFSGCPEDWYITQHIVCGFAHLEKLGVNSMDDGSAASEMVKKALPFCDRKIKAEYEWLKKHDKYYLKGNHLSYITIQYLYMRSYFKDVPITEDAREAFAYYKRQAQKYWLENSRYMQGMLALALNRCDDKVTPADILKSLKENALNSEEMGMYWKENYGGYYWYQAPIEMQALMIEAFDEVANDTKAVDDLKTWLIKSKQTQHWGTTRATTEAVYALLLRGTDWLSTEPNVEISLGTVKLDPKNDPQIRSEAGTGYFKKAFTGSDIQPAMGKIKVVKKDAGVSWGAVYWQYFEQLDKITPHETPLALSKKLFLQSNTASGPVITPITENSSLKPGDKIKVRIELRVDRDMEYVHLKDMRAAGFEPVNVFSGYRYQDGLGYYESTRDAATNFFISYLPKGTYVFEYPVVVSHYGDFSNGVSSIQCMYAPEFTSHSQGVRVKVRK